MKKQYYFKNIDSEICYYKEKFIDDMKADGVSQMTVVKAYPYKESGGIFWCRDQAFCGYDSSETCGKQCSSYIPRNSKSGCCKYHTTTLYAHGEEITLKLEK